jgi:hypothetical protein
MIQERMVKSVFCNSQNGRTFDTQTTLNLVMIFTTL